MEKHQAEIMLQMMASQINNLVYVTKKMDHYKSDHALYSIYIDKIQVSLERLQEVIKQTKTML
jgi:uncharacterized lipoprotein YehR (DUF1307 family)